MIYTLREVGAEIKAAFKLTYLNLKGIRKFHVDLYARPDNLMWCLRRVEMGEQGNLALLAFVQRRKPRMLQSTFTDPFLILADSPVRLVI